MNDVIVLTNCLGCPCVNQSEYGTDCNLGYETTGPEATQFKPIKNLIPKDWHFVSPDCRLYEIAVCDEDGGFKPQRKRLDPADNKKMVQTSPAREGLS